MRLLRLCTLLLFGVSFANAMVIFYPLMRYGKVIGYEPNVWIRVTEFSLHIVFMLLALVALTMGSKQSRKEE